MASRPAETFIANDLVPQKIRVVETNPWSDPRWEAFVNQHPNGSIYHHPAWLSALHREYGQEGVFLICEDADKQILAILPLLYTKGLPFGFGKRLTGRRLSSLPRTPVAGPLSTDTRATVALVEAAVQLSRQRGVQLQIKRQGPDLNGLVEGLVCTPWRESYLLHLTPSPDGTFRISNSHSRSVVKWAINKATKLGVHARAAETESELAEWYKLYLETMRSNVVPPRPYRFFKALWDLLKPRGVFTLLLAEQEQAGQKRIIAGSIFLSFRQTVSYAFNGVRMKDLPLRPNDVIQWHAINDACKKGFRFFDFGEVPQGNVELAKFKSKWGAEPVRLHRYYHPISSVREQRPDEPWLGPELLTNLLWQKLPLSAICWLGDRIYSYL